MTRTPFLPTFALVATFAFNAAAAPLCIRSTEIPMQCIYEDPALCEHEARRIGGECAINPLNPALGHEASAPVQPGVSPYCMITSNMAISCAYPDHTTCEQDAERHQGACVASLPEQHPATDPYQQMRPY